ncbi:unnamed protein product [Somion occarium]
MSVGVDPIVFAASLLILFLSWKLLTRTKPFLPPGPRPLPIIGNALLWPNDSLAYHLEPWRKRFGDIIRLVVLGKPVVFLTSHKDASALFDKRGSIYSNRPPLTMVRECCEASRMVPRYGAESRVPRKMMKEILKPSSLAAYDTILKDENLKLLTGLLESPDDFPHQLRRMSTSFVLRVIYGYKMASDDDYFVKLGEKGVQIFERACVGAWAVNFFPSLRFLPGWLPGVQFKRTASQWRETLKEWREAPYQFTKSQLAEGEANHSFVADLLEYRQFLLDDEEYEEAVKFAAVTLYGGGADTFVASMWSFILAMTLHPEIQKKAQAEIDGVTRGERLPDFSDLKFMPFVEAVFQETLRWGCPVTLSLPHFVDVDDEYKGYIIEKKTTIVGSLWHFLNDTSLYQNPERFDPTRFSERNECLASAFAFSVGRRRCPAAHLAEKTIRLNIARVLATFDIRPPLNAKGDEVMPEVVWNKDVIRHPQRFNCRILPRSKDTLRLIQRELAGIEK